MNEVVEVAITIIEECNISWEEAIDKAKLLVEENMARNNRTSKYYYNGKTHYSNHWSGK